MTRHVLPTALYAPIRVLLRDDAEGGVAFEYDRPTTTFGRFGKKEGIVLPGILMGLRNVLAEAAR